MGDQDQKQDKQKIKTTRLIILILSALLLFGNNYSFDNPQALQSQIMEEVHISLTEFNYLYSFFSFPNILLTLIGGYLIDRIGSRKSIIIFASLVTVSQTIIAFGGKYQSFHLMLFGRVFFGVASENLIISQNVIITAWFKGHQLSTASGCIVTLPEIAAALNSYFSPMIYDYTGSITYPLFTSVFVCIFSLLCAILLLFFDKSRDSILQQEQLEKSSISGNDESHDTLNDSQQITQNTLHSERARLQEIREFPALYWYLTAICSLCLGIYISFMDDVSDYYQKKFQFKPVEAGKFITIPYIFSALLCPFIGYYIDKVGHRRFFLMITSFLFIIAQILFGSVHVASNEKWIAAIPLIIQGLAFTCYSCVMIPCVQYIVDQKYMGTAFGILGMFESIALCFFPIIAGKIVEFADDPQIGYKNMSLFYSILGLISLFLCITLYHYESSNKLDFIDPNNPLPEEIRKLNEYSMITEEKCSISEEK
ncbi:unnamed protein product [Paramecium octaurelia]|uniref:Major facilitator superfamily (MFS) profile domain-containing protein n=1 Tax=Paramecium octaurelia TaxID=43137 RepID=A0A8S1UVY3_PAROT|nr:unnamed protein product [Paramecium octaurelia]